MTGASLIHLTQTVVNEQDVVTEFEQILLVGLVFVIMFGLGAGLTPRDFRSALRRPWGLIIGFVTQFGIMPLLAYLLVIAVLFQLPREYAAPVALGPCSWAVCRPGRRRTSSRTSRRATSRSASS